MKFLPNRTFWRWWQYYVFHTTNIYPILRKNQTHQFFSKIDQFWLYTKIVIISQWVNGRHFNTKISNSPLKYTSKKKSFFVFFKNFYHIYVSSFFNKISPLLSRNSGKNEYFFVKYEIPTKPNLLKRMTIYFFSYNQCLSCFTKKSNSPFFIEKILARFLYFFFVWKFHDFFCWK